MKVKILSKDERETLKKARAILKQVARYNNRIERIRDWCDENKSKDNGGKKWKAATAARYDLYDETWNVGIGIYDDGEVILKSKVRY